MGVNNGFIGFLSVEKKSTANIAKERLQIIVAERRRGDSEPPYLADMKRDILQVICKYVQVDPEMLSVQFEQKVMISQYLNSTLRYRKVMKSRLLKNNHSK